MLSPSHHNMDRRWKPNVELAPNCPRCDSSNTKFCYYNNYSLGQPRYFCKGCRRYWTKGGSLRNVPVGGGCRKNRRGKSSVRLSCGAAPQGNRHSLPAPIVRPDLMLNDMARSDVDATAPATGAGGSVIDLEVLYAKYLNQCPVQMQPADPVMPESQVAEINPETLISVGTSTSESSSCNQVPVQPPNQQVFLECQSIIAQPMEEETLLDHSYSINGVSNLSVELSNPLALPIMEPVNNYISNLDCPSSSNLGYEEFESVSVVGSMNHQQSLVNDEYWSSLDYSCLEAFYRS